jgi:two-component system phosphate regulon response regulator OmpR
MTGTETDPSAPHILVVDDDRRLRTLLRRFLSEQGFLVSTAEHAADARAKLGSLRYDLLVVDIMMPGEDGLSLTRDLRARGDIPILLLTARGAPEDRIAGLEEGADDYMPKPFDPRELVLRIRSILKRVPKPEAPSRELRFGRWRFDPSRDELTSGAESVALTTAEARLLRVLAARPGETVSREDLSDQEGGDGGTRAVDVQVTRLRRKMEDDPRLPRYLVTVRGEGYALRPDG